MVAPSNGFNRIGESNYRSYGPGLGAKVILPKHLLSAATSGATADYNHLLHDNYETPLYAPQIGGGEVELQQLEKILKLSVDDFMTHARTVSSPDELSVYVAKRLMQRESPNLLWITMHDIDIAHSGAYSLSRRGGSQKTHSGDFGWSVFCCSTKKPGRACNWPFLQASIRAVVELQFQRVNRVVGEIGDRQRVCRKKVISLQSRGANIMVPSPLCSCTYLT